MNYLIILEKSDKLDQREKENVFQCIHQEIQRFTGDRQFHKEYYNEIKELLIQHAQKLDPISLYLAIKLFETQGDRCNPLVKGVNSQLEKHVGSWALHLARATEIEGKLVQSGDEKILLCLHLITTYLLANRKLDETKGKDELCHTVCGEVIAKLTEYKNKNFNSTLRNAAIYLLAKNKIKITNETIVVDYDDKEKMADLISEHSSIFPEFLSLLLLKSDNDVNIPTYQQATKILRNSFEMMLPGYKNPLRTSTSYTEQARGEDVFSGASAPPLSVSEVSPSAKGSQLKFFPKLSPREANHNKTSSLNDSGQTTLLKNDSVEEPPKRPEKP